MKKTSILSIAAVAGIALSTPAMASLQDAVMGEVTKAATTEVQAKKAEVATEVTKEVAKTAAHSVGVTGSDAAIEKAVDTLETAKKVQALPEGSMKEIATDAAGKMAQGKDMTTAVTEAVETKTAPADTKTDLIKGVTKVGEEGAAKVMDQLKDAAGVNVIEPAAGTEAATDAMTSAKEQAVEAATAATTSTEAVQKTATATKEETSIWDSITGLFN